MVVRVSDVLAVLGGKAVIRKKVASDAEMARVVAQGLPGRTLRSLRKALKLTTKEFGEAILIPERTLLIHQKRAVLPVAESDRVYRLAQVTAEATDAFGDAEKAARWLRKPSRSLGGITPLEAARTSAGVRLVEEALGQIMYGNIG